MSSLRGLTASALDCWEGSSPDDYRLALVAELILQ